MLELDDENDEKKAKNRERQRKYRQKSKHIEIDEKGRITHLKPVLKRLDMYLAIEVKGKLDYISHTEKKTNKELIEELINTRYAEIQKIITR